MGLRFVNRFDVVERPLRQSGDRLQKRAAEIGQRIIDARRDRGSNRPADEAVTFEVAPAAIRVMMPPAG